MSDPDAVDEVPISWSRKCVATFYGTKHHTGKVIDSFNDVSYFVNGVEHREDGPARIWHSFGDKLEYEWWLYGNQLTFSTWCKRLNKTPEEILLLRITYGI